MNDLGATEIGGCRLICPVGQGGMAVVYRAVQVGLGREVAVKLIAQQYAEDPTFRERFVRECHITAQIDHPNVIPIHHAGDEHGRLFIVMKLVTGRNLRQLLEDVGRLDAPLAVEIIVSVASALDAAHARGLVHRDITPANVLVEDATGHVYLTDFGIARDIAGPAITSSSEVIATVRYAAPERVHGADLGSVRGDVFSLGCVLWELLAGRDRPTPSSLEGVPEALDEVVLKAAALDPADRYATAGDCAAAARRALERDPVPAVAPTRLLSRPRRRSPFPEALSAGLAARVRTLCADITARLDDSGPREAISRVRRELDEPLKLAIAGRTGVGKSTLTNALLGRRIAQTGPGETTRLVSWYRYGFPERVEVVLQDGNRIRRGLGADGTVPDDLGIDLTLVESVDVWLQNDTLQAMTIIDTPGLSSLSTALSSRSKRLIGGSDAALARADALLFVMAGDAREDDEEALEMFSASCRAADRASAVNLVGVLSKADRAVGHAPDLSAAQRIADRIHRQLGQLVSTVVPVASLLAETANTGSIREAHAGLLRTLAASAGPAGANGGSPAMLASVSAFLDAESPVPRRDREELIDLLGLFGIRRAFELAAAGRLTGVEFVRLLRERSGIEDLRRQIDGFGLRADALKADAALRQLDQLSFADRRLQFVRSEVAQVRREPDMHVLELFRSLDRVASGRVDLPIELIEELQRLITARTLATRLGLGAEAATGELMAAASERHRVWKTFENDPSTGPAAARAAFPVIRAYEILLDQARQAQERGRHESLSPQ